MNVVGSLRVHCSEEITDWLAAWVSLCLTCAPRKICVALTIHNSHVHVVPIREKNLINNQFTSPFALYRCIVRATAIRWLFAQSVYSTCTLSRCIPCHFYWEFSTSARRPSIRCDSHRDTGALKLYLSNSPPRIMGGTYVASTVLSVPPGNCCFLGRLLRLPLSR